MSAAYKGPLRDERPAVELYNTVYASGREMVDGLDARASANAWLTAMGARLPAGGKGTMPTVEELSALRHEVRRALAAVIEGSPPPRASVEAINRHSARAPRSLRARMQSDGCPVSEWDFGRARRADVVLGALAADAIDLLAGPDRENLRGCGAPGCVLIFIKDHPRREWCSAQCGNRARQARHYQRTHNPTSN